MITRSFNSILYTLIWLVPLNTCLDAQNLHRFERTRQQMGTTFKIILYSDNEKIVELAIDSCWKRLDELNMIFSDYEEYSECTMLSENAGNQKWLTLSDEMWYVLRWSNRLSMLSEGAFDVTLGPLTKLWRQAIRQGEIPSQQLIDEAREATGYALIEYDTLTQSACLQKEQMRLDFGGVAKGYAVDELSKVLLYYDISKVLVDGGGDIYMGQKPPNTKGWHIQIDEDQHQYLENIAIATSGDKYKNIQVDSIRISHIVDAQSGYGVKVPIEVESTLSVIASSCMVADALATSMSALSIDMRQKLLDQYPGSYYIISEREKKNQGRN